MFLENIFVKQILITIEPIPLEYLIISILVKI